MSNSEEGMHPVLITGGAGATGLVVAERLATAGYPIILGTRSQEKFDVAVEHLVSQNLPEPKPFIANLRDPESTQNALDSLQMSDGQPLHFLSLAAEGIKDFRLSIGKAISPIRRTLKDGGQPNEEQMIDATGKIKVLVLTDEVQQAGRQANFEGPRALSNMLAERGHLGSDSKIMTLSSSLSDSTIPDKPSDYQGPWFYYPIGNSKALGVGAMREVAERVNSEMVDVVAPEISGTEVGDFLESLLPVFQALDPNTSFEIPKVTKEQVAGVMYGEMVKHDSLRQRTVYVDDNGLASDVRPFSWNVLNLKYL